VRSRSLETVNSQVKAVLEKTHSSNRTQAIRLAANVSSSFLVQPLAGDGVPTPKRIV
jgi:hypothetical protein